VDALRVRVFGKRLVLDLGPQRPAGRRVGHTAGDEHAALHLEVERGRLARLDAGRVVGSQQVRLALRADHGHPLAGPVRPPVEPVAALAVGFRLDALRIPAERDIQLVEHGRPGDGLAGVEVRDHALDRRARADDDVRLAPVDRLVGKQGEVVLVLGDLDHLVVVGHDPD
jgi:hypothetical protein